MKTRGYPVSDFDQRAADISVDHPRVVENYRSAHEIALRLGKDQATTEDLRTAMIHYRSLFEELVQVVEVAPWVLFTLETICWHRRVPGIPSLALWNREPPRQRILGIGLPFGG
jgi:hypothetical protein